MKNASLVGERPIMIALIALTCAKIGENSASLDFADEYISINQANAGSSLCVEVPYAPPGNSRQIVPILANLSTPTLELTGNHRK